MCTTAKAGREGREDSAGNGSSVGQIDVEVAPGTPRGLATAAAEAAAVLETYAPVLRETAQTASELRGQMLQGVSAYQDALMHKQRVDQAHADYVDDVKTHFYEDLGLDVDEAFNKRRIFGGATKTLLFSVYCAKTSRAFARFKAQVRSRIRNLKCVSELLAG